MQWSHHYRIVKCLSSAIANHCDLVRQTRLRQTLLSLPKLLAGPEQAGLKILMLPYTVREQRGTQCRVDIGRHALNFSDPRPLSCLFHSRLL